MLSLGKLAATPDAGRYYVRRVASGREDYYAGHGEAPGSWIGAGSAQLGLGGRVEAEGITRLLAAQDPATGRALRRPLRDGAVAGFDLCFKAPKSVSLVFGIAEPAVSGQVRDGHDAAVGDALAYLERTACVVRRGQGGHVRLPGGGFVAAAFRHRTSRAMDPQLHTHVVLANAALGPDGRWTALYGQALYAQLKTAGYVYQASLRAELSERLGVRWERVHHGAADLAGIEREVLELFSKRRAEILQAMDERGEHSARAAQIATLDTRPDKPPAPPAGDLRGDWRAQAESFGLHHEDLADRVLDQPPAAELTALDHDAEARRLLGPGGLTEQASTFTRPDVVRALAEHARAGDRAAALEARADALLRRPEVVHLDDGRHTTTELLELEAALLSAAAGSSAQRTGTAAPRAIDRVLRQRRSLSDEQAAMVAQITGGPGTVQVVRAAAGTGKTFALDAAREAWESSDIPVLGCALSARAACELRDHAAITATTIARLRHALDGGTHLQHGCVLIVDEAGMVGTRDLHALTTAVHRAHGRIVLVGDDRQLPEIQAGGAFRALARQQTAVELHEVRRQHDPADRRALAQLRDGNLEEFARSYLERGRVVLTPTAQDARTALVNDWWAQAQDGEQRCLMIANRRADVRDLNRRARDLLRAYGQIAAADVLTTEHRAFTIGDRVIATHNDRRLGLHNGQTGRLTAADEDRLTIRLDSGEHRTLPTAYAHDGHLDHGYALTAHRAQGATVDNAFVLGSDELYREWGYTALSRHRYTSRFYLAASPEFLNQPPCQLQPDADPAEAVVRALQGSRAQHLALTEHRPDPRLQDRHNQELRLAEYEARRDAAQQQHDRLPWFRRGARAELAAELERLGHQINATTDQLQRTAAALVERPAFGPPALAPAGDPLTDLPTPRDAEPRTVRSADELDRCLDTGLDRF